MLNSDKKLPFTIIVTTSPHSKHKYKSNKEEQLGGHYIVYCKLVTLNNCAVRLEALCRFVINLR